MPFTKNGYKNLTFSYYNLAENVVKCQSENVFVISELMIKIIYGDNYGTSD